MRLSQLESVGLQTRRKALRHGESVLHFRIREVEKELRTLQQARTKLCEHKWEVERVIIEVKYIPMGVGKEGVKKTKAKMEKDLSKMSKEDKLALLERLKEEG